MVANISQMGSGWLGRRKFNSFFKIPVCLGHYCGNETGGIINTVCHMEACRPAKKWPCPIFANADDHEKIKTICERCGNIVCCSFVFHGERPRSIIRLVGHRSSGANKHPFLERAGQNFSRRAAILPTARDRAFTLGLPLKGSAHDSEWPLLCFKVNDPPWCRQWLRRYFGTRWLYYPIYVQEAEGDLCWLARSQRRDLGTNALRGNFGKSQRSHIRI